MIDSIIIICENGSGERVSIEITGINSRATDSDVQTFASNIVRISYMSFVSLYRVHKYQII